MAGDIETVVRIRPPGRDPYGDPLPRWTTEVEIPGCRLAPGPSRELGLGTNQVDSDATLYGPPGIDVEPTDRLRVRGQVYSVVGDPQDWGSAGVVVVLRKFT